MRLVASVVTAFAVLTSSAYAAEPPAVSSWTQPAIPVEGQAFELLAGGAAAGVSFSWDLDGDGVYGDAAGARVSQVWPRGTRTVSVRATDAAGRDEHGDADRHRVHDRWPAAVRSRTTSRMEIDRQYDLATSGSSPNGPIAKIELDTGDGTFRDASDFRNSWRNEWVGVEKVSFHRAGDCLVRSRVTDNKGVTGVGTITVRVVESDPAGTLNVTGESFDRASRRRRAGHDRCVQPPRGREVRVRPRRRRRLRARQGHDREVPAGADRGSSRHRRAHHRHAWRGDRAAHHHVRL